MTDRTTVPCPTCGGSGQVTEEQAEATRKLAARAPEVTGQAGGKAGTGEAKSRGDSDYYRALVDKRKDRRGGSGKA